MAFDLSTPEAQLAFKIAVSAQKTQDAKARLERQARNSVTAQLAPYGQSVDDYDSDFRSIYDPAANKQQAQAQAMQRYVTGLPELLDRVRKEKLANKKTGSTGMPQTNPLDYIAIYKWLLGTGVTEEPETPKPIAVTKNLGGGKTYGNVGGYGAIYPTPGALKPKYITNPTGTFG